LTRFSSLLGRASQRERSQRTNLKAIVIALVASIAAASFGQVSSGPIQQYPWLTAQEQGIESAFAQLRADNEVMLALNGTDQVGPKTTALYSNAFFQWDPLNPDSFAKAEINDYVNNAHLRRIVGDGTTLWSYDFLRNTYSTFIYGSYTGGQPSGFRSNMLEELSTSSQASTVYLARMLKEIFSGKAAIYTTWLPGATVTLVSKSSQTTSMKDPVDANRTYTADDTNFYVVYTYPSRPQRSAAFHFTLPDTTKPWVLSEIFYADLQHLNPSTPRLLDWTITVYTDNFPETPNFVFVPPANSHSIANARGGG